jgi:hypothetical protein
MVDRRKEKNRTDILVIYKGSGSWNAVDEALRAARSESRKARILQILDSDLYNYGRNDLVAPRLNKQRFLLYIRDQDLEQGVIEAKEMRAKAEKMGVSLEIDPVETDDLLSTVIAEAGKGYESIYLAKEKRRIFPLLQKHLATQLRKRCAGKVIEC